MKEIFPGVFVEKNRLFTKGLASVYGEEVKNGFREWNPHRSKLAAAILNGLGKNPIDKESNVLYLGASTGTTASHVSDIVVGGHVYALEFSETSMRKLIKLSEKRENMSALLQDARRPEDYQYLVGDVDIIYQDVAQSDQSEILKKNADVFLEKGGYAMICIKARSIDTTKSPKKVFEGEKEKLSEAFEIVEEVGLDPYDKDHAFLVLRLR